MSDKPIATRDLPGIDFRELRMCDGCGNPLTGKPGEPKTLNFYRVRIESAIVNLPAVQQFAGLAIMMGGSERLADVFAPDRHAAKIYRSEVFLLCCACTPNELHSLLEERGDATAPSVESEA